MFMNLAFISSDLLSDAYKYLIDDLRRNNVYDELQSFINSWCYKDKFGKKNFLRVK